jgi:hypothetical protein
MISTQVEKVIIAPAGRTATRLKALLAGSVPTLSVDRSVPGLPSSQLLARRSCGARLADPAPASRVRDSGNREAVVGGRNCNVIQRAASGPRKSTYPSGCTPSSSGADKEESGSTPARVLNQSRASRAGEAFRVVDGARAPQGESS